MPRHPLIAFVLIALVLGFIVFATLAPFSWRPVLISHRESQQVAGVERLLAFGFLGFLVGRFWSSRVWLSCILVVGLAVGLEAMQALRPDRHPEFLDVLEKSVGGLLGICLAVLLTRAGGWGRRVP